MRSKCSKTDVEKARAIYDGIVENTFRDPETRGCGLGDIRFMLESKNLGGKCADLNALYVGLARAAALPARDVYGIRVAKSDLGYKSLGGSSANVTKYFAHDVVLPGSAGRPVSFLMYPQAETAAGRLDSLNPESFTYEITAREVASANTDNQ